MNVNIIGAGLAGSILHRYLVKSGFAKKHSVRAFDAGEPWAASPNAENLFSMSWSSFLPMAQLQSGFEVLQEIAPIKQMGFKNYTGSRAFYRVAPEDILLSPGQYLPKRIDYITDEGCISHDGREYEGVNVVCSGYWTNRFLTQLYTDPRQEAPKLKGIAGHGLLIAYKLFGRAILKQFAPYREEKLFQYNPTTAWYSNSTAILLENYQKDQERLVNRLHEQASALLGFDTYHASRLYVGIRPKLPHAKGTIMGMLQDHGNTIINSGGYKCGTIVYAYHAPLIHKLLCDKANQSS